MSSNRSGGLAKAFALTAVLSVLTAGCAAWDALPFGPERMSYLDNGIVRLGVDLNLGGSITYLADSAAGVNVVNNYDWGRQVQMSFYSGPTPFHPGGKKSADPRWAHFGWNPIQSGDYAGYRSKVIEHRNDGKTIYVKCIPMHWALDNEPGECTFESWLSLEGNTVHARCRLNNMRSDKTNYGPSGQELPAVYTNAPYWRLITYTGAKPFTGDAVQEIVCKNNAEFPWEQFEATECWSAHVNDDGWGLGVWYPGRYLTSGGFYEAPGKGGCDDKPTGYIAPLQAEILDHNIVYEFRYVLILGSSDEIRRYVYANAERPAPPRYIFASDRQHWCYGNASDTGWPIRGELNLPLEGADPQMSGPAGFWYAADAPKLYIRAAYRTKAAFATVLWRTHADRQFDREKSLTFPITPDGEYHTYQIDMSSSPQYTGAIMGLRLDPAAACAKGDSVRVKWISFRDEGSGE